MVFTGICRKWCTFWAYILVGGWTTPLKNHGVRQLGWWNSQLNGKIKNDPNHQPVYIYINNIYIYIILYIYIIYIFIILYIYIYYIYIFIIPASSCIHSKLKLTPTETCHIPWPQFPVQFPNGFTPSLLSRYHEHLGICICKYIYI